MSCANSDRRPAFALVDVNSFYCSCEVVFDPRLKGKPLVTLSNNDGCIIARSAEAKSVVKMGEPWHLIRARAEAAGVIAFSSNYALYADMSSRVMTILAGMAPALEIYSIDECFMGIQGMPELRQFGLDVKHRLRQWVGLPVCVGFGSTKTRAKLANHVAKKRPEHGGVVNLEALSPDQERQLFHELPVNEVWGIGGKLTARLNALGIRTVLDLQEAPEKRVREHFSVVLEKTISELRGVSCLSLELVQAPKKQIVSSRSFGEEVTTFEGLREAVLSYVHIATEKLRVQHSTAEAVAVGIRTNPFKPGTPQYSRGITVPLGGATDDTLRIGNAAQAGLRVIFRPGFRYKKAEVLLTGLGPKAQRQSGLFDSPESLAKRDRLNAALDRVNTRFGRGTLAVAGAGIEKGWTMQRQRLSPAYTTRWDDLPVAR